MKRLSVIDELVIVVAFATGVAFSTTQGCGASTTTALNSGLVAVEGDQQRQCVDRYSPDATAERECRAGVTATWDHYWASRYPDAGLWEAGQ